MRTFLVLFLFFRISISDAQSYVDSGIRHFGLQEYDEAMIDFEEAEQIMSMITERAKAKVHYYRGMIWLHRAENSTEKFAEGNPLMLSYDDLKRVTTMDTTWKPQVDNAFDKMYPLIIAKADSYLKLEKKQDELPDKLELLDIRIEYLNLADELDISIDPQFYLASTNKKAGDLIFENSSNVTQLQNAKKYYEEALKHFELARYEDPFSKDIIKNLLTLSNRLADEDRIKEYEELLRLAGG